MTKRHYILFRDSHIEFPDICPVCGCPATEKGSIVAPIQKYTERDYVSDFIPRPKPSDLLLVQLHIPVCSKHFSSAKERSRLVSLLWVMNGLLIAVLLYLVMFMSFLIDAYDPSNQFFGPFTLFILILVILTNIGLRPTALEKAVRIEFAMKNSGELLLSVAHNWYKDHLIATNPMKAMIAFRRIKRKNEGRPSENNL